MTKRFTSKELADMKLPGFPGTSQGWDKLLKARGWEFVESHGRGRGGMRREYLPPPDVLVLIEARQRGEFPPEKPTIPHKSLDSVSPTYKVDRPATLEGFVLVPRYEVSASMGNGQLIHSEQIVDHLAFKSDWVRRELGANPHNLVLISTVGDSMIPSLHPGDLLLIDRGVDGVKQDAIYAIAIDGELCVKRIQRLFDGSLVISSDNPSYRREELTPDQAEKLRIIGRVVWAGRRM